MTDDRAANAPVSLLGQPIDPLIDWAATELARLGIEITGPATEIRRRDWSLLARIPTDAGQVWVKANARAFAHEGPLLSALARLRPGSVLEPLAVQPDRGWLLSPDGGVTARDSPAEWAALIDSYVDLQHAAASHLDELRATGIPDLAPPQLITVYRHFESRIPGLGPRIAESAAALAEFGRLSVEHNDLHTGNVFADRGLIFDWGDAVLTHPFLSHRTLRGPHRNRYLDRWREYGPVSSTEVALADRLAPLVVLNSWRTIDASAPEWARVLRELLDEVRDGFG
ncbi:MULTISPECIES: phosphotransferase [unclassified Nocardia]|uniref:phosphotransferase n=1 Tax=unclassified Nocardia TaxID=2637762 RepID=UPI001CE48441|nr:MULTISPECIES: phosphotransferase [unclassified Nocardia]